MKNILMLYTFLCILGSSCSSQNDKLNNTKWVYSYDDCQDYFIFKERGKYEFYSCETGDTTFGNYSMIGDTVLINQEYGSYDSEFKEGSRHRLGQSQYKLIIKSNQLGYLEQWDNSKNKWKEEYYYQKIEGN